MDKQALVKLVEGAAVAAGGAALAYLTAHAADLQVGLGPVLGGLFAAGITALKLWLDQQGAK